MPSQGKSDGFWGGFILDKVIYNSIILKELEGRLKKTLESLAVGFIAGSVVSVVLLLLGTIDDYGRSGQNPNLIFLFSLVVGARFSFPMKGEDLPYPRLAILAATVAGATVATFSEECGHEDCVALYTLNESVLWMYSTFTAGVVLGGILRIGSYFIRRT